MDPPAEAGAAILTLDEARTRSALVGSIAYAVELDLADGPDHFRSTTTITFTAAEAGAATFVDFAPGELLEVTLNGRPLTIPPVGHRVPISGLATSNSLRIVGRCPFRNDGVGLHRFQDPTDGFTYCYSHFEPFDAHRVFACFDQPDCKGPITLSVRAPAGWTVIGNSRLIAPPAPDADAELAWWRFRPTPPISTYVSAVAAGPFHSVADEHRGLPLGLHCRRSLAPHLDSEELLTVTKQGLDFFPALFGHPYPFDRYDQVFVPEFNAGAMENAGCVTIAEGYLFRGRVTDLEREDRADTLLHEMAHMWFGDLVTLRWWEDLWLNESFATLLALLACTRATRFRDRWLDFASWTQALARQADQRPTTHPVVAVVPDIETVPLNLDRITYEKGCSVLRQLLALLGEEAFAAGLKRYIARHRFGNAELGDFLAALGAAAGRDLTAWSRVWLQTSGVTTLRVDTGSGPVTAVLDQVVVRQARTGPEGPLLPHRISLGLYHDTADGLCLRRQVPVDVAGALTPVPELRGEPRPALLLPNDGALTYAKVRLDPASLEVAEDRLADLADPLARTLVWETLRDMLRDAELPIRRYVALVERHGVGESEPRVLLPLLRNLVTAVERFSAPEHAAGLRRRVAGMAQRALTGASPGGDLQLAWTRIAISLAGEGTGARWLGELLDGGSTLPDLPMDVELRWSIVTRLGALGDEGVDERVDAELRRDPGDIGRRHAAAARAACPTAAAKAEAWAAASEDPGCPVATARAILRGFQQAEQETWLAPYAERYLAGLEPMWRSRDLEMALTFAAEAFPRHLIDPALVDRLEAALGSDRLASPLRRVLVEGQDDCRRALRARACDAAAGAGAD